MGFFSFLFTMIHDEYITISRDVTRVKMYF
jgi:hypothetical protein